MTYVHFCTNSDVLQLLKIHTAITYFYSTFAYKSAFTPVQKYHGITDYRGKPTVPCFYHDITMVHKLY